MNKKLVSLSMLIAACTVSLPAMAATDSITKTTSAPIARIYSMGTNLADQTGFGINMSDFKSGVINKAKKLTNLRYDITSYPGAYTHEAELCYFQPYKSAPTRCIPVTSGSSSSTTAFNDLIFNGGVRVEIRHKMTGAPTDILHPSRKESVTVEFSY